MKKLVMGEQKKYLVIIFCYYHLILFHFQKSAEDGQALAQTSYQIERNTILVTVFHSIMNQTNFRLVQNQKENCYSDRIPFSTILLKDSHMRH